MLSNDERITSFAHRNLNRLKRFRVISQSENLPPRLEGQKIIGVYSDDQSHDFFVTMTGLYDHHADLFVAYDQVQSISTNVGETDKVNVDMIKFELSSGESVTMIIKSKYEYTVGGFISQVNDLWSIYTFLTKVCVGS